MAASSTQLRTTSLPLGYFPAEPHESLPGSCAIFFRLHQLALGRTNHEFLISHRFLQLVDLDTAVMALSLQQSTKFIHCGLNVLKLHFAPVTATLPKQRSLTFFFEVSITTSGHLETLLIRNLRLQHCGCGPEHEHCDVVGRCSRDNQALPMVKRPVVQSHTR